MNDREQEKEISAKLVEYDVPDSHNNIYSSGCFRNVKEDAKQDDLTDKTDYYIKCYSNDDVKECKKENHYTWKT